MARPKRLRVHEIYASVQGESTYAGLPCTFVRLTGCNLRCRWCDTEDAFYDGQHQTLDSVVETALAPSTTLIEVTGGEPLLQRDTPELLRRLADAHHAPEQGRRVLIETSGEADIRMVDPRVVRIVDLKAPGSGECGRVNWDNLPHLRKHDEVKCVVADREDFGWFVDVARQHGLAKRVQALLVSPVHGEVDVRQLAEWVRDCDLPLRLNLQLHKYIWGAEAKHV